MSFTFNFSGDDIEDDPNDASPNATASALQAPQDVQEAASIRPQVHKLEDLLSSLPSRIAYSSITITSPKGKTLAIPKRELFDIRLQLMAEDDGAEADDLIGSLDKSDLRTNVYEGGFKTWECSIDLARLLLDRGPRKDLDDLCRVDHVIEMGCGTAIPTLTLFHYAITEHLPLLFTLTDYNAAVLRLVTLPNLLLTWASTLQPTAPPFSAEEPNPLLDSGDGDLAITPELTAAFINHLRAQGLELTFISGSWTPPDPFLSLIPSAPTMNTLILASETIYSPTALSSFTAALTGLLSRVRLGKAMIAAKRVYFGVGGSVDAFKIECRERDAVAYEIDNHGVDLGDEEGGWGGVRRCLVEVQML